MQKPSVPLQCKRIKLADTELFIEIEQDFTTYDEVKFGGGKVIREIPHNQCYTSVIASIPNLAATIKSSVKAAYPSGQRALIIAKSISKASFHRICRGR